MEKIKPVLQWLFRNRFWVTCVLVSVISLATWYLAWSKIEKERNDRATKLNQSKSSIENVLTSEVETGVGQESIRVHPNDGTAKGMQERIKAAADGALAAWSERYNKQKELLQFAEILPEHIRQPLAAHDPMEKPLEKELLDEVQRETVQEEIPKHMPEMAKRIQTTWQFDDTGEPITEAELEDGKRKKKTRGTSLEVADDLVIWDIANQTLWNSKATQFQGFNGNLLPIPTSQQLLALQQDMWILGGIFDAVAEVNKGFTANDLAPIERIDHVLVGAEAVNNDLGSLAEYTYNTSVGAGGKKKGKGLVSKTQRRRESNERRTAQSAKKGAAFDPEASQSPFHGRYVNRDFSQLNEKEITNAITSDKLTEQSYLAVAKRVPVRIAVKMDERRINEFLAAAANSPFAFEIRQVRINKHVPGGGVERKGDSTASSGGKDKKSKLGLGGGAGGGSGRVDGGPGGGKKRGGSAADDGPFRAEGRSNFDIDIEFIGIVKIYNPVNRSLFLPDEPAIEN